MRVLLFEGMDKDNSLPFSFDSLALQINTMIYKYFGKLVAPLALKFLDNEKLQRYKGIIYEDINFLKPWGSIITHFLIMVLKYIW